MVRIKFESETDEVNGFYLLATRSRLRGLPNGVYELSQPALKLLNQNSIHYTVIRTSQDADDEAEAIRNPLYR